MTRPIVTVELNGREVLRLDGDQSHIEIGSIDQRFQVVEALNRAASVFLACQPPVAPLAVAADAAMILASKVDPDSTRDEIARVADAVVELAERTRAHPATSSITH